MCVYIYIHIYVHTYTWQFCLSFNIHGINWCNLALLATIHNTLCVQDENFVKSVPAEVLAPNGASPSAGAVQTTKVDMTTKLDMSLFGYE